MSDDISHLEAHLGKFSEGVRVWSKMIAAAEPDLRSEVFLNCIAEGASFVSKGAPRGLITSELIERADRHDLVDALGGPDAVEQIVAEGLADADAKTPRQKKATKGRFELVHIDDIEPGEEPLWLIDEILPAGPALAVVFGAAKARKTFLVADMLYHVAMGRAYCGGETRQGAVVYITTEGARGFRSRMKAMRQHYGIHGAPFYTITGSMPNLGTKSGDAEMLVKAIRAVLPRGMVVAAVAIDTLARAMSGQSDADGRDMGIFIDSCDHVAQALKCLMVIIHHSPRSDATRTRGSNVLDGAADALISVAANGSTSTVTVEALKDGEAGLTWDFELTQIEVTGEASATKNASCAPLCATKGTPTRKGDGATKAQLRLTASQRRFIDILSEVLIDVGETVPASNVIPTGIKAVMREQLKKALQDKGFLDGYATDSSARAGMSNLLNQLAGKHVIGTTKEHVWLPR